VSSHTEEVLDYYAKCWIPRIRQGHNGESLAIHYGYYDGSQRSHDLAKADLNRFLVELLEIRVEDERRVIDCGCGVGGTAIYLAQRFPRLRIHALNIDPVQIELARRFAVERSAEQRICFASGDFARMPYEDRSFDCVYAIESMCQAADAGVVYAEASRVLTIGGRLAILDHVQSRPPAAPSERSALERLCRGGCIPDCHSRFREKLRASGFRDVDRRDITPNVLPGIVRSADNAARLLPELRRKREDPRVIDHYDAVVALRELIDIGVISYSAVLAVR